MPVTASSLPETREAPLLVQPTMGGMEIAQLLTEGSQSHWETVPAFASPLPAVRRSVIQPLALVGRLT